MRTSPSNQDGLTFIHNSSPEGGELRVVVDPTRVKVDVENFNDAQYFSFRVDYNAVRDFILGQLAAREIAKIEAMNGDELAAYYTGDWTTLDKLQQSQDDK